jgi:hypothetical protein
MSDKYKLIFFTFRRRFTWSVMPRLENVGSSRLVGAFMAFSLVIGYSCCRDGWCSRMFLYTLLRGVGLTWLLSLSTWRIDVDGLACPLHRPTVHSCQMRTHGLMLGNVLSCRCSGRWCLIGGCKALGLDICGGADWLGTCVIEFYTNRIDFTRICFPYVGIIMMWMCVSLILLPF